MINHERIDWPQIKVTFIEKAKHKNIEPTNLPDMFSNRNYKLLLAHWQRSLGNHFSKDNLPEAEIVFSYLKAIISTEFKF